MEITTAELRDRLAVAFWQGITEYKTGGVTPKTDDQEDES